MPGYGGLPRARPSPASGNPSESNGDTISQTPERLQLRWSPAVSRTPQIQVVVPATVDYPQCHRQSAPGMSLFLVGALVLAVGCLLLERIEPHLPLGGGE